MFKCECLVDMHMSRKGLFVQLGQEPRIENRVTKKQVYRKYVGYKGGGMIQVPCKPSVLANMNLM